MSSYLRKYVSGGTYFFTVVSHKRRPILATAIARSCLHEAIESTQHKRPFDIVAIVLMPDHLHTVWTLPEDDTDYSLRWKQIKELFTKTYIAQGGSESKVSSARKEKGERGIWQPRFWEHTCRNEQDLKRCVDYIHWNPVKHGLISRVCDYPWSSFHRYVQLEEYPLDWGGENPCPDFDMPE